MSINEESNLHPEPGQDQIEPINVSPADPSNYAISEEELARIHTEISAVKNELAKVIIGQEVLIDWMLAALITNGHVLLEGVPGIAKTLISKLLAQCLKVEFKRIQFTPDLMPTDILGTTIFDMKRSEFEFRKGPIFSNIVLIDEINRAPAKTQAALMEVMEEEQITVDGTSYTLESPFMVIATQNPIEQEGTYKLPEAQLDRFLFKISVAYPSLEEETRLLDRFKSDFHNRQALSVEPVISKDRLIAYRHLVESVYIEDQLVAYIAAIVQLTRNNSDLYLGASPRASLGILKAAKALALLDGRAYVRPDDIKKAAIPVLNHRLILSYEREIEGAGMVEIIERLIRKVAVPR